jgi:hypothetical protein
VFGPQPGLWAGGASSGELMKTLVVVYLLLVAAVSTCFFLLDHPSQVRWSVLKQRGVTESAVVTRAEPQNHNIVYFTYQVNGAVFTAADSAGAPNPDAGQLRPGDTLRVVYDPAHPATVCACTPSAMISPLNEVVDALVMGGFLSAPLAAGIAVGILRHRRARQLRWSTGAGRRVRVEGS